jgi:uncharacterized protein (DUF849 family)
VLLQAALNGPWTKAQHPAVPASIDELAQDALACVAAGARAMHLHPRDQYGRESLDPAVVDGVAAAVRDACGFPVGVSTGAWIEPDLKRRLQLIGAWTAPDYASVNLSEDGAEEVMDVLLGAGIGVEAGVWSPEDAERLAASGFGDRVTRILVEPVDVGAQDAIAVVDVIHAALDRAGLEVPRLQHGDGHATWVLIEDAIRKGIDTRVGLEDTQYEPGGELTAGNAALVRVARELFQTAS